jgi:hypothetical protein
MITSATTWWAPKAGNAASEYEDAYAVKPEALRFAVADGASESSFARQWAELLVEGFVQDAPSAAGLPDFVTPLQAVWAEGQKGKATAWYSERKAADGAFSSLLGVTVDGDRWKAVAIGDTCLFVVRAGKMLRAFPLERSEQFSNRPSLLSSVGRSNAGVWSEVATVEGELQGKDRLLLMTDALAQWFLVESEMGRRPWAALAKVTTPEQFAAFVEVLRAGGALRNDDVTLVNVEVAA